MTPDCIDIHTHVVPANFPPYAGGGRDAPWPSMAPAHACPRHVMIAGEVYRRVADGSWSVRRRIEDMGAMRITRQVISPMPEPLSYWLPLADARVMVRYLNDQIAAMVAQAPARLVGLGAVPLQDMDAAIRELEYCKTLKFSGVEIASHVNGTSIGDPRFEPFFAAAEKLGAAIFVHALRPAGHDRIVGAFPQQAGCFPGDLRLPCASLITGGLASRHPKLRIASSRGGGVMSILLARLVPAGNISPRAKESLAESPAVTAKRFYYDQLVFEPRAVQYLIDIFGASQICIGTDYPFALGDTHPMKTLELAGIHGETLVALSSTNARRFLGL